MGDHRLYFVRKGKVIDVKHFNHPVRHFWEGTLLEKFAEKKTFDEFKKICDQAYSKNVRYKIPMFGSEKEKKLSCLVPIQTYRLLDYVFQPLGKLFLYNRECIVRIVDGKHFKENCVVTLDYRKEEGWSMEKGETHKQETIDVSEPYDMVIYVVGAEAIDEKNPKRLISIGKNLLRMKEWD